jgi:hypothetical protein
MNHARVAECFAYTIELVFSDNPGRNSDLYSRIIGNALIDGKISSEKPTNEMVCRCTLCLGGGCKQLFHSMQIRSVGIDLGKT